VRVKVQGRALNAPSRSGANALALNRVRLFASGFLPWRGRVFLRPRQERSGMTVEAGCRV